MSKDKAEEKAREYAQSVVDSSVENYMGEEIFNSQIEFISQCYLAGYNSLSTENAQLREALSSTITKCEQLIEYSEGISGMALWGYRSELAKSKQLLTDNTQEK